MVTRFNYVYGKCSLPLLFLSSPSSRLSLSLLPFIFLLSFLLSFHRIISGSGNDIGDIRLLTLPRPMNDTSPDDGKDGGAGSGDSAKSGSESKNETGQGWNPLTGGLSELRKGPEESVVVIEGQQHGDGAQDAIEDKAENKDNKTLALPVSHTRRIVRLATVARDRCLRDMASLRVTVGQTQRRMAELDVTLVSRIITLKQRRKKVVSGMGKQMNLFTADHDSTATDTASDLGRLARSVVTMNEDRNRLFERTAARHAYQREVLLNDVRRCQCSSSSSPVSPSPASSVLPPTDDDDDDSDSGTKNNNTDTDTDNGVCAEDCHANATLALEKVQIAVHSATRVDASSRTICAKKDGLPSQESVAVLLRNELAQEERTLAALHKSMTRRAASLEAQVNTLVGMRATLTVHEQRVNQTLAVRRKETLLALTAGRAAVREYDRHIDLLVLPVVEEADGSESDAADEAGDVGDVGESAAVAFLEVTSTSSTASLATSFTGALLTDGGAKEAKRTKHQHHHHQREQQNHGARTSVQSSSSVLLPTGLPALRAGQVAAAVEATIALSGYREDAFTVFTSVRRVAEPGSGEMRFREKMTTTKQKEKKHTVTKTSKAAEAAHEKPLPHVENYSEEDGWVQGQLALIDLGSDRAAGAARKSAAGGAAATGGSLQDGLKSALARVAGVAGGAADVLILGIDDVESGTGTGGAASSVVPMVHVTVRFVTVPPRSRAFSPPNVSAPSTAEDVKRTLLQSRPTPTVLQVLREAGLDQATSITVLRVAPYARKDIAIGMQRLRFDRAARLHSVAARQYTNANTAARRDLTTLAALRRKLDVRFNKVRKNR